MRLNTRSPLRNEQAIRIIYSMPKEKYPPQVFYMNIPVQTNVYLNRGSACVIVAQNQI